MKLYKCLYEAGNGCTGEFTFWSSHRAGSKSNKYDAIDEMKKRWITSYGIIDIYRFKEGEC